MRIAYVFLTLFIFLGCMQHKDVYSLPSYTENGTLQVVIEIPAGTNAKIEYQTGSKTFAVDQENGQDRIIQYLPYPGNYGFIPGTFSNPEMGGDGDALDALVLCSSLPTGTVIEVIPIAVFKLLDNGETDYKILAVPKDNTLRTIQAKTLENLNTKYPKVKEIVALWFLNYNSKDTAQNLGWGNEEEALLEVKKAIKK